MVSEQSALDQVVVKVPEKEVDGAFINGGKS